MPAENMGAPAERALPPQAAPAADDEQIAAQRIDAPPGASRYGPSDSDLPFHPAP
jgi:hypothetical protein